MYVTQFSFILFLTIICVALGDINTTVDVEVKSEVENVSEDVFHLGKTCASDEDCHHLGKCVANAGGKFCNCKNGTSGDFCEKVDECVDNPVKCGTLDDVSCVFDIEKEMAVCKCDNASKTYVEDEERCMSPCVNYYDCGQYGYCYHKIGSKKFCACDLGTSGDYCEIIDACHNKVVDCGVDNNATCTLGGKGKAYCKCNDVTKGFDYDNKICTGCEGCGENAYYGAGGCIYRDGLRRCSCRTRYYSSENGTCEDCKCGQDSYGCKLENGTKICQCSTGAAHNDGFCQKCDCGLGLGVKKCEFKDGKKICTCKEGYSLVGPNGPCKQTCASDEDCHHLGKCVSKAGGKFCNCKKGTSGDFCEKVDECVDNPEMCGTLDDVSCLFDIEKEMAVCKCDNASKTYVEDEERCMSPCVNYYDCGQYGYCYHEIGNKKFCACDLGTSGDYCEIIDACHNKVVDCGVDNNATCTLGGKGKAYCKCDDEAKGFDYDNKVCKGCEGCGENAYYGAGGCIYRDGIRRCSCRTRYYSSENGTCEDCKCGQDSYGCKFENGKKICQCWTGAAHKDGFCQKCDCGSGLGVKNCEFKDGKKICTCKEGYSLVGPNGPCRQTCNATNTCANGGKCVQSVCNCLKGTSGDFCGTIDECRGWRKCGSVDCLYNISSQEAYCKCKGSLVFDDYHTMCKECSCGPFAKSCAFVEGMKRCNCTGVYEDRLGTCTLCFCTGHSSIHRCKFDDNGDMKCQCSKGYSQLGDECKKCDCGDHGKCSLYGWWSSKVCTCDEGYIEYKGMCEECNCGKKGSCRFGYNGEKTCSCQSGYKEYQGTCKACNCGWDANCAFNEYGTAECTCNSGYGMKDGVCTPCNCYPGTSCTFTGSTIYKENKVCICPKGYADDKGNCRDCDCKAIGSNCTYSYGFNRCQCPEGFNEGYKPYSSLTRICVEIDTCRKSNPCPASSTKCVNKLGSYECVCKPGYEAPYSFTNIERDGCKDINECVKNYKPCNDNEARCVNTQGSYRCECKYGYIYKAISDEKRNICSAGYRPWRVGSIIVGVSSAVIIIGLLIAILHKKHSS